MRRNLKQSHKLHEDSKEIYKLNSLKKQIDVKLNRLLDLFQSAETTAQRLTVINTLDSIVSSEIYHWSNILADLEGEESPCMEIKRSEAEYQLLTMIEIIEQINLLRQDVINQ